jgi:glycerophosphoryl diester phosphodiesterase
MEALIGAVSLGYRHIETDLRMTADGVLVCLHDREVDRTTDGHGPVSAMTIAEVTELDAGYRHSAQEGRVYRNRGLTVPTFEEVVQALPDVNFVVDLKADGMASELGRLVEQHALHDRLIVGSLSDRRIREVIEVTQGRVATSTGLATTRRWLASSRIRRPGPGPAAALQVPVTMRGVRVVDERLIAAAHSLGLQVHVWTVNHRAEIERLLDLGVDGLVTDRPDLLREVLTSRGEWATS